MSTRRAKTIGEAVAQIAVAETLVDNLGESSYPEHYPRQYTEAVPSLLLSSLPIVLQVAGGSMTQHSMKKVFQHRGGRSRALIEG